ncbi:MAG: BlaI/MecI/CopY family transcriptional regulator [Deltaproteobacteria bacterium]|nr:BlaI/MecI/CopY family transcriptional regulator [Deltaproteobacteria bacterium]
MARSPDLTAAELRVLKALWEVTRGTVADVRAELARRGQELAYTTVMTLLGRLASKGAVLVDKEREPFLYRAAHRRELVLRDRLREFVREVFDGKADSLVLNLVDDQVLTRATLEAIEARISKAEADAEAKAAAVAPPAGTPRRGKQS